MNITEATCKETHKIPTLYIAFPDDVDGAIKRIEQIEEKLLKRGLIVVKPYKITRIMYFPDRDTHFYQLAFELTGKEK